MRYLTLAALATGLLWVGGGVALASDTIRLGGPSAQATIQGGTDTELVRWRHHGHHGYGYGHYNYRPYYSSSYYAQPYYYYPRSYAYSYNYYAPTYYPSTYYYRPSYSYYRSAYHHHHYNRRIAGDDVATPTVTLQGIPNTPAQTQSPSNGTFQYNGGPNSPIPMPTPGQDTNPANGPRGIIPLDGRLVSLPTEMTGGVSPVGLPVLQTAPNAPRATYPAYGE